MRMKRVPLHVGGLPRVSRPKADAVPGAIVPLLLTVTTPEIAPVPPRNPPLTVTAPLPVPDPLGLFTSNRPALTVVGPL
jgi:hypothetical protein